MEAGVRFRRIQKSDPSRRLYRGLYEVAEVAFVRAGSQCHPKTIGVPPTGEGMVSQSGGWFPGQEVGFPDF